MYCYVDAASMSMGFGAIVGIFFFGGLYFLPMILALARRKNNKALIICLNIFLGWTLAGWIVSLVLACINDKEEEDTYYNMPPMNNMNPNQYQNQYPNQYSNQYPNQYPYRTPEQNTNVNQYAGQIENQDSNS